MAVWGFLTGWWQQNQGAIKATFLSVWGAISDFFQRVWPPLKDIVVTVWNAISDFLTVQFNVLRVLFSGTWGNLVAIVQGAWGFISGVVKTVWAVIAGIITVGLDLLTGRWSKAWDDLKHYTAMGWDGIKTLFTGAVKALVNIVLGAGKMLYNAGSNIVTGLKNGISAGFGHVADAARGLGNAAVGAVNDALDIHSPSRVFAAVGMFAALGMAQGIAQGEPHMTRAMIHMVAEHKKQLKQMQKDAKEVADALEKSYDHIYEMTHTPHQVARRDAEKQYRDTVNTDPGNAKLEKAAAEEKRLTLKKIGQEESKDYDEQAKKRWETVVTEAQRVNNLWTSQKKAAADLYKANTDAAKAWADGTSKATQDAMKREIAAQNEAAKHTQDVMQFEYATQQINRSQFRAFLAGKQADLQKYSDEWMRVTKEIYDLDQQKMQEDVQNHQEWVKTVQGLIDDQLATLREVAGRAKSILYNSFESLFSKGFKGFFDTAISGFRQMLSQMASDYLSSTLLKVVGKLLDSAFPDAGGAFSDVFGGARASGGPVSGGQAYLVGEQGPELFVAPGGGGSIVPNHALATGSNGGGSVTVNMTVVTQDANSFNRNRRQTISDMEQEMEYVKKRNGR